MKSENKEWINDFNEFVNFEETSVPQSLSDRVLTRMDSLLNPSAMSVFLKVLGIHFVVGFLSLSVCHQFDVNPFRTPASLADVFMKWGGHSVCMVFCGVLFLGLSLGASGFFLSIEEVRALRRTEFIQGLSLGVISLGAFAVVGAELALTFAGLWLLGALIGGFIATETVWQLKKA